MLRRNFCGRESLFSTRQTANCFRPNRSRTTGVQLTSEMLNELYFISQILTVVNCFTERPGRDRFGCDRPFGSVAHIAHCSIGANFGKCYSPPHGGLHSVVLDGIRHSVEVEAAGLYEASVLGICAFRKHELIPSALTELEVEVHSSVTHSLPVSKVHEWLERGVRTPKEAVLKERLRSLMSV